MKRKISYYHLKKTSEPLHCNVPTKMTYYRDDGKYHYIGRYCKICDFIITNAELNNINDIDNELDNIIEFITKKRSDISQMELLINDFISEFKKIKDEVLS